MKKANKGYTVMSDQGVLKIRAYENKVTKLGNKESADNERFIYMLFENRVTHDAGITKTYGISICGMDFNGEVNGNIICDVSCCLSEAQEIYEKICRDRVLPDDMSKYISDALDVISAFFK